jgi:hypothetical protein
MVRGIDIPPAEFEAFARTFMEQRKTTAVPDIFALPTGMHARGNEDDGGVEDGGADAGDIGATDKEGSRIEE